VWWHYVVGYTFAIGVGHLTIRPLSLALWSGLPQQEAAVQRDFPGHPQMVGMLERALYVGAWQAGHPEFIGVWLVLKVAGEVTNKTVTGRPLFNVFLVGTGVSIGYGVLGGAFIDWLGSDHEYRVLVVSIVVVAGTIAMTEWAKRISK
jgi:hypothetical protein